MLCVFTSFYGERSRLWQNKKKGVSSKTHTQKQLDDYANQHNPNNKAYKANQANMAKSKKHNKDYIDNVADLEWFCYGWCDD